MKSLKLVKGILPVFGAITLISGCATTSDMYGKYDDICEVPTAETVERVKVVKEVVEKERIVEKKVNVPVEKIKYVDRIKIKEVPKVKYVDRVKIKEVPKVKYVERVKIKEVPKIKYVDRVKTVKQMMPGVTWEPAVYFGFDQATLETKEMARLDRDLLVLRKKPALKLSIQAFTDSKGSNQYNRDLAIRRQETVVNYLVSKGLAKERIRMSPLGEELPILGDSEAERVVNRRVELMLLDAAGRPLSLSIQAK